MFGFREDLTKTTRRHAHRGRISKFFHLAATLVLFSATLAISQQPTEIPPAWNPSSEGQAPEIPLNTIPLDINGNSGPVARVGAAGEMIGFTNSDASGSQTITLVHTGKSWMAVYHIDRSGKIRLVSSRPIDADFTLQLNATAPLPDEIREMGGR